jgi:phage host-nuclease inhibitor protein Gam
MTTKQIKAVIKHINDIVKQKSISGDEFQATRSCLLELKAAVEKEGGPDLDAYKKELATLKKLKTEVYDFAKAIEDVVKNNIETKTSA